MPSPFPGMDPWLETSTIFPEFHNSFITYLRESINSQLPSGYVATSATRVWVSDHHMREPDIGISARDRRPAGGIAVLEMPGTFKLGRPAILEQMTESFLEIRTAPGRRLITAIEVLSPSNKYAGNGRTAYRQKQDEFVLAGVCLVEIDLLRDGPRTTLASLFALQEQTNLPECHVSFLRPWADDGQGDIRVTPVQLREPLPVIPIPLDPDVPSVVVELQPLLDRCYDSGRYVELADYSTDPVPPLPEEHREWAEAILRDKGLRS